MSCIGVPISWLRLETYALDGRDAAVTEHVAACPACARCLDEIRGDATALPRLPVVAAVPRPWARWLAPAFGVAIAAAIVLIVVRPREPQRDEVAYGVKGVGDVVLGVVRERAGVIRDDVFTYAPGDRWKVVVTCAPSAAAWVDVAVTDPGGTDYPIAPARIACGNRVAVPGAFAITGGQRNVICVRISADAAPLRSPPHVGDGDVACLAVDPEPLPGR